MLSCLATFALAHNAMVRSQVVVRTDGAQDPGAFGLVEVGSPPECCSIYEEVRGEKKLKYCNAGVRGPRVRGSDNQVHAESGDQFTCKDFKLRPSQVRKDCISAETCETATARVKAAAQHKKPRRHRRAAPVEAASSTPTAPAAPRNAGCMDDVLVEVGGHRHIFEAVDYLIKPAVIGSIIDVDPACRWEYHVLCVDEALQAGGWKQFFGASPPVSSVPAIAETLVCPDKYARGRKGEGFSDSYKAKVAAGGDKITPEELDHIIQVTEQADREMDAELHAGAPVGAMHSREFPIRGRDGAQVKLRVRQHAFVGNEDVADLKDVVLRSRQASRNVIQASRAKVGSKDQQQRLFEAKLEQIRNQQQLGAAKEQERAWRAAAAFRRPHEEARGEELAQLKAQLEEAQAQAARYRSQRNEAREELKRLEAPPEDFRGRRDGGEEAMLRDRVADLRVKLEAEQQARHSDKRANAKLQTALAAAEELASARASELAALQKAPAGVDAGEVARQVDLAVQEARRSEREAAELKVVEAVRKDRRQQEQKCAAKLTEAGLAAEAAAEKQCTQRIAVAAEEARGEARSEAQREARAQQLEAEQQAKRAAAEAVEGCGLTVEEAVREAVTELQAAASRQADAAVQQAREEERREAARLVEEAVAQQRKDSDVAQAEALEAAWEQSQETTELRVSQAVKEQRAASDKQCEARISESVSMAREEVQSAAAADMQALGPVLEENALLHARVDDLTASAEQLVQHRLADRLTLKELDVELEGCRDELAKCEEGGGQNAVEMQFWMAEKVKHEDAQLELDPGFAPLRDEVRALRASHAEVAQRVKVLERAASGGSAQADVDELRQFLFNWEPYKPLPEACGRVASDDVEEFLDSGGDPEELPWPPVVPEVADASDGVRAVQSEANRQKQITLLMKSRLEEMKAEKTRLASEVGSLGRRAETLEAAAGPASARAEQALQDAEKAFLVEAIVSGDGALVGFKEHWLRIRKLHLLASRGGEVSRLLDALLRNQDSEEKQQRFLEFVDLGLIDKRKLDHDSAVLNGIRTDLGQETFTGMWQALLAIVEEAKQAWTVALEAHGAAPRLSDPFLEVERSFAPILSIWLSSEPCRFNELLLEEYMNWNEDLNGAVRVYVKVTNREQDPPAKASNAVLACAHPTGGNYKPSRKVHLLPCDAEPDPALTCAALTSLQNEGQFDGKAVPYGPYYGIFASADEPGQAGLRQNPKNDKDIYASTNDYSPGLRSVLRQVRSGYTVVLFGYGYSGSGKTYMLLGKQQRDGSVVKGVVTVGLEELRDSLDHVTVRVKELYGKMKLEDGRPMSGETGIYSYQLNAQADGQLATVPCTEVELEDPLEANGECLPTTFWGREPRVNPESETGAKYKATEAMDEHPSESFVDMMERDSIEVKGEQVGDWLMRAFQLVTNTRRTAPCRTSSKQCPRIRSTPNNKESSRGHLFTVIDVHVEGQDETGKIVMVDMAGAENPLSIAKDSLDYYKGNQLKTEDEVNEYVGSRLKRFDKKFTGNKYSLWESLAGVDKQINLANAKAKLDEMKAGRVAEITRATRATDQEAAILKAWTDEYIEPVLMPTTQEGVFINEGLAHLKQFLLTRSGKLNTLTENTQIFDWNINQDKGAAAMYRPDYFIQPSKTARVETAGWFKFVDYERDRVPLVTSGSCVVDWTDECSTYPVDGFLYDDRKQQLSETISRDDLLRGQVARIDPVLMLSMLNYFDHPEFFRTGERNDRKRPTKFIMLAAMRREHPLMHSDAPPESQRFTAAQYKALKLNVCRGAEATLKFTHELNTVEADFE